MLSADPNSVARCICQKKPSFKDFCCLSGVRWFFIVADADEEKLLAGFLDPVKVLHQLSRAVPSVKTGPPERLMVFPAPGW